MKKIVLLTSVLLLSFQTLYADNWLYSFENAKKIALAENKLILVDFWASWCGPCKKMDFESWNTTDVKSLMQNYVPVKIDIDANKSLAANYGVKGIPYIFILDANGKIVYQQMSYKKKSEVMSLLKKYALNTKYLKRDLINYYSKDNFSNTFRLAVKYQEYCTYLNKDLKSKFIKTADLYFNEAEKKLKKAELSNKSVFKEKLALFAVQKKIVLNNPKKALKMLEKFEVSNLEKANIPFYYFLSYLAHKALEHNDIAQKIESKLSDADKKKVKLFLKTT
ncbi:thioredoxin family protein [Lacinutrix salivirga]